jgi:hypothetical protein
MRAVAAPVRFEKAGDRWWPIAGGVYFLRATKKVAGMRVIALAWERRERRKKASRRLRGRRKAHRGRQARVSAIVCDGVGDSWVGLQPTGIRVGDDPGEVPR